MTSPQWAPSLWPLATFHTIGRRWWEKLERIGIALFNMNTKYVTDEWFWSEKQVGDENVTREFQYANQIFRRHIAWRYKKWMEAHETHFVIHQFPFSWPPTPLSWLQQLSASSLLYQCFTLNHAVDLQIPWRVFSRII